MGTTAKHPTKLRADSLERWTRAIVRLLKSCSKKRWHGMLLVQFYDGQVKHLRLEKTIISPDALAHDDGDPIESP